MPDIPDSRFIFPLELDGNSSFGASNFTHPFIKINFYKWSAQQVESQKPLFGKENIAQFFFAIPEQTITETFNHNWEDNIDIFKGGQALTTSVLSRLAGWVTGDSEALNAIGNVATRGEGYKINDFVMQTYNNIDFRKFDFMFNLVPKSKEEADIIFKIIKKLKYLTTPELGVKLIFPNICDASIYGGNGKILFQTLLSGVDQLSINYSPEGFMRTFADGNPTQVQIAISMKELRRFSKENI